MIKMDKYAYFSLINIQKTPRKTILAPKKEEKVQNNRYMTKEDIKRSSLEHMAKLYDQTLQKLR